MKTRCTPAALAFLAAAGLTFAEQVPTTKLYKDLADRNRYPAAEGLTSAQADAKCNIMEQLVAAFPDAAGKPIAVKFYWSRPSAEAAPQMKFVISGIPENLTDLSNRANTVFQRATEFVVASPIYWTFEQTAVTADDAAGKITVTGAPKDAGAQIKGLTAEVDGATMQVKTMTLDLGQAKIGFDMTYEDLGGKWGLDNYTISFPQYKQVLNFEYAQVESFWLPSKLTLELQGPDGKPLEPTSIYEFSNWQVNKEIPAGVF
ncbi:MAG TPA: hypothetical protein VJV23_15125 [Candidatus Polarisedimenticolia bacterium]|nr:hypothetical protein [Candidatus Polarisedimenticolia bacterium]